MNDNHSCDSLILKVGTAKLCQLTNLSSNHQAILIRTISTANCITSVNRNKWCIIAQLPLDVRQCSIARDRKQSRSFLYLRWVAFRHTKMCACACWNCPREHNSWLIKIIICCCALSGGEYAEILNSNQWFVSPMVVLKQKFALLLFDFSGSYYSGNLIQMYMHKLFANVFLH
jgi:hypothetical protein